MGTLHECDHTVLGGLTRHHRRAADHIEFANHLERLLEQHAPVQPTVTLHATDGLLLRSFNWARFFRDHAGGGPRPRWRADLVARLLGSRRPVAVSSLLAQLKGVLPTRRV
jgi:hypothetical protein